MVVDIVNQRVFPPSPPSIGTAHTEHDVFPLYIIFKIFSRLFKAQNRSLCVHGLDPIPSFPRACCIINTFLCLFYTFSTVFCLYIILFKLDKAFCFVGEAPLPIDYIYKNYTKGFGEKKLKEGKSIKKEGKYPYFCFLVLHRPLSLQKRPQKTRKNLNNSQGGRGDFSGWP